MGHREQHDSLDGGFNVAEQADDNQPPPELSRSDYSPLSHRPRSDQRFALHSLPPACLSSSTTQTIAETPQINNRNPQKFKPLPVESLWQLAFNQFHRIIK